MKTFSLIKPALWGPTVSLLQRETCTQKVTLGDDDNLRLIHTLKFMERMHCSVESGEEEEHVLLEGHKARLHVCTNCVLARQLCPSFLCHQMCVAAHCEKFQGLTY